MTGTRAARGDQRRERVRQSWASRHRREPSAAGRAAVTGRHEDRGRLVADLNDAGIRTAVHRCHEGEIAIAEQSKDGLDPLGHKGVG
jgi:hypothetical protein